ncbi:cutinase family protein [Streptomyces mirabilis]|uniref:cutinase family protein n=1 Tax=Streptomyces mirabilis TaxID=68239 RepID=UPI000AAD8BC8|nr:cutinase family protein [Streptomyces mirabilis]
MRNSRTPHVGETGRPHSRKRITIATALAIAAAGVAFGIWIASSQDPAGPVASEGELLPTCTATILVTVGGSDETRPSGGTGLPTTNSPTMNQLADDLKPYGTSQDQVDYVAESIGDDLRGQFLGATYSQSVAQGKQQLINKLYLLRHHCPNTKIAVAGYSQGAQVVRETYAGLSGSDPADQALLHHTYAIALFGDPHHRPGDVINVEPETAQAPGALWPSYPPLPDNMLGRLRSWCLPMDPICTGFSKVKLALCVPFSPYCPHLHYKDAVTHDTAAWIATMLHLTTTALPSTTPPVTPSHVTPTAPTTTPVPTPSTPTAVTASTPTPLPPPIQTNPADIPPQTDPGQLPVPDTAQTLGSPNFERYCQQQGTKYAQKRYPNTWGWRCSPSSVAGSGLRVGDEDVSVDDACSLQYGDGAKSHYRSYTDPYSWFCWR